MTSRTIILARARSDGGRSWYRSARRSCSSRCLTRSCSTCCAWPFAVPGWLIAGAIVLIIGGTLAQYFHGTLQRADNPWIVRAMRRVGLLMTPEAHALHHATLRQDFATNTGWSNPLVNAIFRVATSRGWLTEPGLEPR
jgi:hypothetical protein